MYELIIKKNHQYIIIVQTYLVVVVQGMLNNYHLVFCYSSDSHNQKSTYHHNINSEAQYHEQYGLFLIKYKRFGR